MSISSIGTMSNAITAPATPAPPVRPNKGRDSDGDNDASAVIASNGSRAASSQPSRALDISA